MWIGDVCSLTLSYAYTTHLHTSLNCSLFKSLDLFLSCRFNDNWDICMDYCALSHLCFLSVSFSFDCFCDISRYDEKFLWITCIIQYLGHIRCIVFVYNTHGYGEAWKKSIIFSIIQNVMAIKRAVRTRAARVFTYCGNTLCTVGWLTKVLLLNCNILIKIWNYRL